MPPGRKKTRTGNEAASTFEKTPECDIALLDLQRKYLETGRSKPSMRELLMEGIALLLQREGLPAMREPVTEGISTILEMPRKPGA